MRRIVFLVLLLFNMPVYGQMRPTPGIGDPRLQTVQYDPNQVVQLDVASGYQLMIDFSSGERIEAIAVGDSVAWQVTAAKRGDFLFVKNLNASSVTNLTVVTDARVYNFELIPSSSFGGLAPYSVRFLYIEPIPVTTGPAISETQEFAYRITGAKAIRPSTVTQRGNQVWIEWNANQPMPAIFAVENGAESIVNGEMLDGRFIVSGTPEKLMFRLDRKIAYAIRRTLKGREQ